MADRFDVWKEKKAADRGEQSRHRGVCKSGFCGGSLTSGWLS